MFSNVLLNVLESRTRRYPLKRLVKVSFQYFNDQTLCIILSIKRSCRQHGLRCFLVTSHLLSNWKEQHRNEEKCNLVMSRELSWFSLFFYVYHNTVKALCRLFFFFFFFGVPRIEREEKYLLGLFYSKFQISYFIMTHRIMNQDRQV